MRQEKEAENARGADCGRPVPRDEQRNEQRDAAGHHQREQGCLQKRGSFRASEAQSSSISKSSEL